MKTITEIIHKESYHGYHGALIAFCLTWIIVFLLGFLQCCCSGSIGTIPQRAVSPTTMRQRLEMAYFCLQ